MKKSTQPIVQYHLHKAHPEKLQFELYDLNAYRKKSGEKAAKPHSHSYYQIIWFFESGGTHTVDFTNFDIKANTILFISKDQIHAFDDTLDVKGWLIHFNESFFMHTEVDIFLKYRIFNTPKKSSFEIKGENLKMARSYISMLQKERAQENSFGNEEVLRYLLKSFLINLERVHRKGPDERLEINDLYELQFLQFKELLEEHYKKGFSVQDYASALGISTKTLSTITKAVVSRSPSFLISERLILEAKRLLKFTPLQISEIAYKIGFEDASYFAKFFKRKAGQSPKEYRIRLAD